MTQFIAFGHKSDVGKNTCAEALKRMLQDRGWSVELISFAKKLKNDCHVLYRHHGLQDADFYETRRDLRHVKLPRIDKTPLEIWIAYGNAIRREVYPHTWSEYAFASTAAQVGIITDLRTFDEVSTAPEGTTFVKVTRASARVVTGGIDDQLDGFTGWHYRIRNEGTERDLIDPLVAIMTDLGLMGGPNNRE